MKREGRIHKGVSIGAYSILIAFMLLLLWTVLRYPGNHLIPWQMALGVVMKIQEPDIGKKREKKKAPAKEAG